MDQIFVRAADLPCEQSEEFPANLTASFPRALHGPFRSSSGALIWVVWGD